MLFLEKNLVIQIQWIISFKLTRLWGEIQNFEIAQSDMSRIFSFFFFEIFLVEIFISDILSSILLEKLCSRDIKNHKHPDVKFSLIC